MYMLMHGGGIGLCGWGRDIPVAARSLFTIYKLSVKKNG